MPPSAAPAVCQGPISYKGHALLRRDLLPDGKLLGPGARITTFARLIGRERVIAGVDCGFAQGALYQRQHPSVMWAKFEALVAAGARLASGRLWRR
jgi:hypothetical protein